MAHSYASEYPTGVEVDTGIKQFFEDFYKTTDMPDAHEDYVDFYARDAVLIMASKKCVGREGTVFMS